MPTVLLINGFRFFFYSNESSEPIHITKGDADGKIWLKPHISIAYLYGFSSKEEKDIMQLIPIHCEQFKKKWNEYFGK